MRCGVGALSVLQEQREVNMGDVSPNVCVLFCRPWSTVSVFQVGVYDAVSLFLFTSARRGTCTQHVFSVLKPLTSFNTFTPLPNICDIL